MAAPWRWTLAANSGPCTHPPPPASFASPLLGLRANAAQFILLVAVNALVGGMLGQERTVLPLLATQVFGLDSYTAALTYILAFGLAKAGTNYLAGTWAERGTAASPCWSPAGWSPCPSPYSSSGRQLGGS
jgi:hypothetical protein